MNKNSSTLLKSSNHVRANVQTIEAIKEEKVPWGPGEAASSVIVAGILHQTSWPPNGTLYGMNSQTRYMHGQYQVISFIKSNCV